MNRRARRAARYGHNTYKPMRSRVQRGISGAAQEKCAGVRRWLGL